MITPKALNYFPNATMTFVSPKDWRCLTCKVKSLEAQLKTLSTAGIPDEVVTEDELTEILDGYLVDSFGNPV